MHGFSAVKDSLSLNTLFNEPKVDNLGVSTLLVVLPDLLIEPVFLQQIHALGCVINHSAALFNDGPLHVVDHSLRLK